MLRLYEIIENAELMYCDDEIDFLGDDIKKFFWEYAISYFSLMNMLDNVSLTDYDMILDAGNYRISYVCDLPKLRRFFIKRRLDMNDSNQENEA